MRCFQEDGEFLWCIPEGINLLCKYDLGIDKIVFVQEITGKGRYSAIIKCERKLVLVPYSAGEIMIFDMDTERFSSVALPALKEVYRDDAKFFQGFRRENSIYLIPGGYPYFLKLDLIGGKVTKSKNVFLEFGSLYDVSDTRQTVTAAVWDRDNALYFGAGDDRENICFGKLELDTLDVKVKKSENAGSWIKGMVWHEGYVFSYSGDGKIVIMNQNLEEIRVISESVLYDYNFPQNMYVVNSFVHEGKMIFIRALELDAIILDLRDGYQISKKSLVGESIKYVVKLRDKLLVQADSVGYFYIIEKEGCKRKTFQIDDGVIRSCLKKMIVNDGRLVNENDILQLAEWSLSLPDRNMDIASSQNIGEIIYNNVKM